VGRVASASRRRSSAAAAGPPAAPCLEELSLEDFVIVSRARVELSAGLNVLSGETGTGKSILLDALSLLLGGRGSAALVRKGSDRLRVEGLFLLGGRSRALEMCASWGIVPEEGRLLVAREIRRDGSSRSTVNGRTVLVAQLSELGSHLAEIHGPWESQRLLQEEALRDHVDLFGGLGGLLQEVGRLREAWLERRTAREEFQGKLASLSEQEDWIRYQLEEIRAVGLDRDERDALGARIEVLRHRGEGADLIRMLEDGLNSSEGSVVETLESLDEALGRRTPDDGAFEEIAQRLGRLRDDARRLARDVERLSAVLSDDEIEPDLDGMEKRLAEAQRLETKHRSSWPGVLEKSESLARDVETLEAGAGRLEEESRREAREAAGYVAAARALHDARVEAARGLEQALSPHLNDVGWNPRGVRIGVAWRDPGGAVAIEGPVGSASGLDDVSWDVETNTGEGWRPLKQVVSHGELSRLHLALLTVQMEQRLPLISIFDEVDTGIGGETAQRVAGKIEALSGVRQVLLVTHLASLASRADRHYRVEKEVRGGRTEARVDRLDGEARVEEIARMLSGNQESRKARDHARELLDRRSTRSP